MLIRRKTSLAGKRLIAAAVDYYTAIQRVSIKTFLLVARKAFFRFVILILRRENGVSDLSPFQLSRLQPRFICENRNAAK